MALKNSEGAGCVSCPFSSMEPFSAGLMLPAVLPGKIELQRSVRYMAQIKLDVAEGDYHRSHAVLPEPVSKRELLVDFREFPQVALRWKYFS